MFKLYNELATWWPLLSPPTDYLEEARFFQQLFLEEGLPPSPSLLELGCGGGNNAFYLKAGFSQVTLSDLSPQMLEMSRLLNPECEHIVGDMRTLRLGHLFDAVFIHDAIDYMTTLADLQQALTTAFVHCRQGGIAMFVPDYVRETFQPLTEHGGNDQPGRSLRYLEWSHDPDPQDTMYTTDFAYLLREGDRPVWSEHDRHFHGLFPRADWLKLLSDVGFNPKIINDPYGRDIFIAKPKLRENG